MIITFALLVLIGATSTVEGSSESSKNFDLILEF